MIDPGDRLLLFNALKEAYPTLEDLDRMVAFHLGANLREFADIRTLNSAVSDLIREYESGNLDSLLAAAATSPNVRLHDTLDVLRRKRARAQPPYVAADPFQTCLPAAGTPFFDRQDLRRAVGEMLQSPVGEVLAVEGASRSGKSFTRVFLNYLAGQLGRYVLVFIDFDDQYPGYHAGDLATAIMHQLGRGDRLVNQPKPTEESSERWVHGLANWLAGEIRAYASAPPQRHVWVALDGFPAVESGIVHASVHSLVVRLAMQAQEHVNELTLVLLGYPAPLPKIEPYVRRDRITRASDADLRHFYQEVLTGCGKPVDAEYLDQLVLATWEDAAPHDTDDMQWIDRLVRAVQLRLPELLR
jgi:hypothetical protein